MYVINNIKFKIRLSKSSGFFNSTQFRIRFLRFAQTTTQILK
ncbi:hypothetical protein T190607A01A_20519 [Tenacibaculum sp. 190524A05c]|uniref:Uncharacterized protein n=1 Tax=Tenacibaculum platacis TaxID=3137852 RepID=A0ABM9P0M2_9FLAO